MNLKSVSGAAVAAGFTTLHPTLQADGTDRPNLLIIHTDEHNFRTLGCYRETMAEDQAFVWGSDIKVDTPNIDSLAHAGALCTSFYATSPVCSPSRSSFMTGFYPQATGVPQNDLPMKDSMVTFAEVLRQNGYATAYVGKWHLDGDAKPGFTPPRKFGFEDNRYMINRGHWKLLKDTPTGPALIGAYNAENGRYRYSIEKATDKSYTTDFLVDRTIEILNQDKDKPFCVMLSIPDPHGPNTVRAPYDTMFSDLTFQNPRTMDVADDTLPKWVKNTVGELKQVQMQWYFGMVKCIDDNVGRILNYLASSGLDRKTIVVFTSDHGDLMGEHRKHDKGLPYETSAGIAFIIRYPGHIPGGKRIDTAYTTADFAPTILGLMNLGGQPAGCQGRDASTDFTSSDKVVGSDRIIYITNAGGRWVAAASRNYKLVLSPFDTPWLFDLEKNPDETVNFYRNPEYRQIAEDYKKALTELMARYDEPLLQAGTLKYD
jgi:uncharacterized sulfatase